MPMKKGAVIKRVKNTDDYCSSGYALDTTNIWLMKRGIREKTKPAVKPRSGCG